ncbi:MAG: hypothetical protein LBQ65_08905 [Tannerellaceae bacterium]|jgi:hypothetical protein|nr:hypothetical protein [Tannerellaceae bacterium]
MKAFLFISVLLTQAWIASGQIIRPEAPPFPESDSSKVYTIAGYRHGLSFFPKVKNQHVAYEATERLTFDKFHSADVIYTYMIRFAEAYPDLVELYEIAKSYEGRPILQMTVTNKKTGKATDKPGAFFEGNRHSGEVTSAESVLWLMQHLLSEYGKDASITRILDKNVIYLRPINNPDGHNMYIHTAQSNRSTVRPYDQDGDGLLDEDSPLDLNGDGNIVRMRYKDPKGEYIIDPRDPSGRLMKYVGEGKGAYKVSTEGIDQDGDGRIGEDGIGGLDLHRNYPENWRPMKEATGRGWTQGGAGEYPLSEVETRAVVSFLLDNPQIYIVNSMDTRVPMHLRPPSTSKSEDRMYPEDLKWYQHFDALGKSITGYERAGDVYNDYSNGALNPLFGHGPDFGYFYYGSIWYGDELWDNARPKEDLNGDGEKDELDQLLWDERENDGLGFIAWTAFNHPTLGEVEIGGWDPKFFNQNAPSKHLEPWIKNEALFNIAMVKHLPDLEWADVEVKKLKTYKADSADYRVRISYRNTGKLPTALRQADLVKIVKPDRLEVEFSGTLAEKGEDDLLHYRVLDSTLSRPRSGRPIPGLSPPPTNKYFKETGYAEGGSLQTGEFKVRVYGEGSLELKASLSTTRAGLLPKKAIKVQ